LTCGDRVVHCWVVSSHLGVEFLSIGSTLGLKKRFNVSWANFWVEEPSLVDRGPVSSAGDVFLLVGRVVPLLGFFSSSGGRDF